MHGSQKLFVSWVDCAIVSFVFKDNTLDAEEIDFVKVIDEEVVVSGRVNHRREHHQTFQIDFLDLLFDEIMIEYSRYIDQIRANCVNVYIDSSVAILVATRGYNERARHLVIHVSNIHHTVCFRIVHLT